MRNRFFSTTSKNSFVSKVVESVKYVYKPTPHIQNYLKSYDPKYREAAEAMKATGKKLEGRSCDTIGNPSESSGPVKLTRR